MTPKMGPVQDGERRVIFRPAFDKRNPDPYQNYGIHGVDLTFYLGKPKAVIQFVVYTNWHLQHVRDEGQVARTEDYSKFWDAPMAADIGYHARTPQYEGQTPLTEDCSIIGGQCYYDGSSLNAEPFLETLIAEGSEGLWQKMEEWYLGRFEERS